ncbi:hypothetical protein P4O93_004636 [Escherichia coli]|nr:hypothetical protein [Escherichia coli]EKQ0313152.1 hypothetical protein [Escherichia coli]
MHNEEYREQLSCDIRDKLCDCWQLLFRNIPPAPDTMLACGLVLADMRIKAEETKNPFFPHSEIAELVGKAIAHPECKSLDRTRFSDDLVRVCTLCRAAHVGYLGFTLSDRFFIEYLDMGRFNGK